MLEAEIMHLERYLLSLYRTAFEEHLQTLSSIPGTHLEYKPGLSTPIVPNKSVNRLAPQMQKGDFFHYDQALPAHDLSISEDDNSAASLRGDSAMVNIHHRLTFLISLPSLYRLELISLCIVNICRTINLVVLPISVLLIILVLHA